MSKKYFEIAYKEALKAYNSNDVPVGAVIVKNGKILAKSHNNRQKNNNLLGHAEINCILKAEQKLKDWRLDNCDLYVTLEPCELCEIFIKESRLGNVYYLLKQNNKASIQDNMHQTNVCSEVRDKYSDLLTKFFKKLRN